MISPSDITNVTFWSDYIQKTFNLSQSYSTILIVALAIIFFIFAKSYFSAIGQKLGEKHAGYFTDYISRISNFIKGLLFFIPCKIGKILDERRIGSMLRIQVNLLSNADEKIRKGANQKIINILSSSNGSNAAIKNKIPESLIKFLSSDSDEARLYSIQNLNRIVEQSDKKRSVSPQLIDGLMDSLHSDNDKIKNESLALLRLIVYNNCGSLFVESLENIHDFTILPILIDLLQNILEIEEKNDQILIKIFSLLNGYLNSENTETKKKALTILENRINNEQFAELALESEIIPSLFNLLLDDSLKANAQQLLIKIGRMKMLPQIMEVAKAKEEMLPKKELSCIIFDTISTNNFDEILESGIIEQIFSYLPQTEFYTRSYAGESIIRLLFMSAKSPKKSNLILKFRALGLENQILSLLSDSDIDIQMCGINIVQALVRVNGFSELENEDIIKSLICCFFTKSTDVNYRSAKTVEQIISYESIIHRLCDLGCESEWQDHVADWLASLICNNHNDPIAKWMDDFEQNLDPSKKNLFFSLKEKISTNLKINGVN